MSDVWASADAQSLLRTLAISQTVLLDYVGGTNPIYVGWALPGSSGLQGNPIWKILRITYDGNGNPTACEWADGDIQYDNVYANRAGLTYS